MAYYRKKTKGKKKSKRRPKGTVTRGFLKSKGRYSYHTLSAGTLPQVGSKDLKFFDLEQRDVTSTLQSGTTSQPEIVIEVLTDGTGIPSNSGVSGRIGSRIYAKTLQVKGQIGYPRQNVSDGDDAAMTGRGTARVIVVLDKQPNQALATVDEVLSQTGTTHISQRHWNYENLRRFKVCYDKLISIPAQQSGLDPSSGEFVGQRSLVPLDFEIPLGFTVKYDNTADGAVGNVVTNNLIMIIGMDQIPITGVAVTDDLGYWTYSMSSRILFTG